MKLPALRWATRFPTALVVNLATLGPLGRRLPAPGTWGSAAGLLYAWIFFRTRPWEQTLVWTVLFSLLAVGICDEAERRLRKADPGEVVLDEFIVMPLVFMGATWAFVGVWPEWAVAIAGFALFRLFDILKPFGIARLQRWPGGWGVMADDFVAALAACASLHVLAWVAARFF